MRAIIVQHVEFESEAMIAVWLKIKGIPVVKVRADLGEAFPAVATEDFIVLMGGPMSVNDETEFPFLAEEKKWVADAVSRKIKILGICLGAQMIASSLGKKVYKNLHREIGWFPLTLTDHEFSKFLKSSQRVFHWHGETFDLPEGAHLLASTTACVNQAFLLDHHVLGLQFHLEMTEESVSRLIDNCGTELDGSLFVQEVDDLLGMPAHYYQEAHAALYQMLEKFLILPV
jgi:GMP synthase-like glutamine amidotransferase